MSQAIKINMKGTMCTLKFDQRETLLSLKAREIQSDKININKSPRSKKKVSFLLDIIIVDHILALLQKNETFKFGHSFFPNKPIRLFHLSYFYI